MIGQELLKEKVEKLPHIPRFCIIEGSEGSGRKTAISYISDKWKSDIVYIGNKVDDIRDIISDSQSLIMDRIYVISGEGMSNGALNSLLKITEEPPKKCHIAMVVSSSNNVLPTLQSRAYILSTSPYSIEDKLQYIRSMKKYEKIAEADDRILVDYCNLVSNLGELGKLLDFGAEEVFEKVNIFLDSIGLVSESNSLKVANWFSYKESEVDKIDPIMFFNALINYISIITWRNSETWTYDDIYFYDRLVRHASRCLRNLKKRGGNSRVYINEFLRKVSTIEQPS